MVVDALNSMEGVRCRRPEGALYVLTNVSGLMGRTYKDAPLMGLMLAKVSLPQLG
jgi:aspartate aminotransferase